MIKRNVPGAIMIDKALDAIERDNPRLKGVLNKRYAQLQIDQAKLIDLIATIPLFTNTQIPACIWFLSKTS